MKTCPNKQCGATNLPDDAHFCPECGWQLVPGTIQWLPAINNTEKTSTSIGTASLFFPIDEFPEFEWGKSTLSSMQLYGWKATVNDIPYVNSKEENNLDFWAWNYKNGSELINGITLPLSYMDIPSSWQALGLKKEMSYLDYCVWLDSLGFEVRADERKLTQYGFEGNLYAVPIDRSCCICIRFVHNQLKFIDLLSKKAVYDLSIFHPSYSLYFKIFDEIKKKVLIENGVFKEVDVE